uniref:Putative lipopolysaccharide-induced tumor necrosis factor-alpha factor protein isoform x4 n=1 Tax=Panstrongylus lignarius TaxID=156445 RepID=A0A224Y2C1_9HEMI
MNYQKDAPPPYGTTIPTGPPPPMMAVMLPTTFGPNSQTLVCPSCHTNISTSVRNESTTKTHLFALLLCIIFCPLVCLPYCMDSCQASNHYCPKCGAYLGTYDS